MSDLEEKAVAFFRALRAAGKECFGHDRFGFKLDVNTMSPAEDKEAALKFNEILQGALTVASNAIQPKTIDGVSVQ